MHQGSLPPEFSFLTAQPDNIIVTAVKKAEDGDALIVRFYEWAGAETDARLQLPAGAISAAETNLMETPIADLPLRNGVLLVHTKPYEIKTVRVQFAATPSSQTAPTTGQ
jgi:alpha-mannosidase